MNLEGLEIFLVVAKSKSMARSAEILDMTVSSISRKIKKLEEELNTELFHRGGKEFHPTSQGEIIAQRAEILLAEAQNIRNLVNSDDKLHGPIRILIPPSLADILSIQFFAPFMQRHPEIELRVKVTLGRKVDTLYDNDFAFSPNLPQDTSLIARPLFVGKRYFYAGPELLAKYGMPESPADLSRYPFVGLLDNNKYSGGLLTWDNGSGRNGQIAVSCQITSDYPDLLASMVSQNLGVGCLTEGAFRNLPKSSYVRLFDDETYDEATLYGIFASREHRPHRVNVFVEELIEFIGSNLI
ncbi:LysR family transcriptional regulator [Ferrimonas lipolytica]|uniref:LysR family transcriptional regulator n=1 Tax=Ferrimonas lipolytica TaxID=2724191 RepID=A0A6H1UD52_9GAMM|nr:LysR family transcriptional regulator [Ferrimonas lipolytica]QIZ76283.1 LysR family transcriptional regulator [Ferrimonas lipolytica]